MNARTAHEVRLILWPWCLMTLTGIAPLIQPFLADKKSDWPVGIAVFGFFGGAAILVAISFRDALKNALRPIWSEKTAVLMIATVASGLIAFLAQLASGSITWRDINANALEPLLLLAIIVCSVGFWTLVARSVLGGLALAAVAQFALYLLLVLFARTIDGMLPGNPDGARLSHEPGVHSALSWFVGGFGFSYAVLMLWLGRTKLANMARQTKSLATEQTIGA